jgi:hypothetical protein
VTVDPGQTQDLKDVEAVLSVYRAEARLALGDPSGALETLRGVGDDCSAATDAVLTRIDAYATLGRSAEVERELGRLLAVAGPRAGDILAAMLAARRETQDLQGDLVPVARALVRWLRTAGDEVRDRARLELAAADACRQAEQWREALGPTPWSCTSGYPARPPARTATSTGSHSCACSRSSAAWTAIRSASRRTFNVYGRRTPSSGASAFGESSSACRIDTPRNVGAEQPAAGQITCLDC